MRPLRYSINITLDGCDHQVMVADADLHRHAVAKLERADAIARTINAAKKYVVSSTLAMRYESRR